MTRKSFRKERLQLITEEELERIRKRDTDTEFKEAEKKLHLFEENLEIMKKNLEKSKKSLKEARISMIISSLALLFSIGVLIYKSFFK